MAERGNAPYTNNLTAFLDIKQTGEETLLKAYDHGRQVSTVNWLETINEQDVSPPRAFPINNEDFLQMSGLMDKAILFPADSNPIGSLVFPDGFRRRLCNRRRATLPWRLRNPVLYAVPG